MPQVHAHAHMRPALWVVVGVLVCQVLATVSCGGTSSEVLTELHGEEMKSALLNYFSLAELDWTRFDDPSVLREVETGEVLASHQWIVEHYLSDGADVFIVDHVVLN